MDPRTVAEVEAAQRTCERLRHVVEDPDDAETLADTACVLADLVYDMEETGQAAI